MQVTLGSGETRHFDPSQWFTAGGMKARPNASADNLAFGDGPRRCAGQSLGTAELITFLVVLARECESFSVPPAEVAFDFPATSEHPTGMPVTFTPRTTVPHPSQQPL